MRILLMRFLILFLLPLISTGSFSQQIILDYPTEAGELTLFPDLNDQNLYYYLPDKVKLAVDKNGRPQFSFLRYVQNVRTGSKEEALREGEGGGIVHAVVSLEVSDEQLKDAERDLQQKYPEATIKGPIIYKSGKFGLISTFKEENGEFSKRVLGLGNAPILEGHKAAISLRLTKLGAKILWESFQTATPDITFSFAMDLSGYRLPVSAKLEANFDKIYDHKAFGVGAAYKYLGAEIAFAFDELRQNGAIKLEQVGSDKDMEKLISMAYNKLMDYMFTPASSAGSPVNQLSALKGGKTSLLDRATKMANQQDKERVKKVSPVANKTNKAPTQSETKNKTQAAPKATTEKAKKTNKAPTQSESKNKTQAAPKTTTEKAKKTNKAPTQSESKNKTQAAPKTTTEKAKKTNKAPTQSESKNKTQAAPKTTTEKAKKTKADANKAEKKTPTDAKEGKKGNESKGKQKDSNKKSDADEQKGASNFAIVASFEMKKIKQKGTVKLDFNKWNSDVLPVTFVENIGNLAKYMDDPLHFRQVNLDDPLYRQREIVAFIDGYNAADFKDYINFVTVRMQKKHAEGAVTPDEVRIDRYNFNDKGNYFKMLYGWKGDKDRRKWMEYDYEVLWSFFGDYTIHQDFTTTTFNTINLSPPLSRKTLEIQADASMLEAANVRLVTVKLFNKVGEKEYIKQVSLNPSRNLLSEKIDYLAPRNSFDYEYEITWRLRGNKIVNSGRLSSSESILFVDEVPVEDKE
jgi:hypothetical protein